MILKYVMFKKGMYYRPILFFEPITHVGIAEMFTSHEEGKGYKPVSAGEYDTNTVKVFGNSISLNLKSSKKDASIIYLYDIHHGII